MKNEGKKDGYERYEVRPGKLYTSASLTDAVQNCTLPNCGGGEKWQRGRLVLPKLGQSGGLVL